MQSHLAAVGERETCFCRVDIAHLSARGLFTKSVDYQARQATGAVSVAPEKNSGAFRRIRLRECLS